jgi:hypothetical protein
MPPEFEEEEEKKHNEQETETENMEIFVKEEEITNLEEDAKRNREEAALFQERQAKTVADIAEKEKSINNPEKGELERVELRKEQQELEQKMVSYAKSVILLLSSADTKDKLAKAKMRILKKSPEYQRLRVMREVTARKAKRQHTFEQSRQSNFNAPQEQETKVPPTVEENIVKVLEEHVPEALNISEVEQKNPEAFQQPKSKRKMEQEASQQNLSSVEIIANLENNLNEQENTIKHYEIEIAAEQGQLIKMKENPNRKDITDHILKLNTMLKVISDYFKTNLENINEIGILLQYNQDLKQRLDLISTRISNCTIIFDDQQIKLLEIKVVLDTLLRDI